jgi:hypothetical protein
LTYFLAIVALSSGSCRIHYGFSEGEVPPEAKTASVDLFVSNAGLANPNLPLKITEKLKDQILSQTKLLLVRENADLKFSGVITGYDIKPMAVQTTEIAGLNRLTITIQATYVNKFDEKRNYTQTFSRFADYDSSKELTSVEDQLMDDINKQLVQDMFDKAFSNW